MREKLTVIISTKPLKFNFFGRFFGNSTINLTEEGLSLESRKGSRALLSFSKTKRFAYVENGFFGSTLFLHNGQSFDEFKFLSKTDAVAFVDAINKKIAHELETYVAGLIECFNSQVVTNYPRDSRVDQIKSIVDELVPIYKKNGLLWDYFNNASLYSEINKIHDLMPIEQKTLGTYHEKIHLEQRQSFFDSVESNPLTYEQRLGVLRSNDKNMVLAAAGTGKTSVMVAKALDLIDRGLAHPTEILILAYNKAAAKELQERLADKAENSGIRLTAPPQISTFHALGRQIIREAGISTYMSVFTEDSMALSTWVTNWLIEYLSENPKRFADFISLFPEPVNPFNFNTQKEYEQHVRDNEFRTLQGELVKGYQELLIANWLALHRIPYKYEAPYVSKRRIDIGFDYRPDFHILDSTIYIEHFGIDRQGNTRPDIDKVAYNDSMRSKRNLHRELKTTLVETFHYDWIEGELENRLEKGLAAVGIFPDKDALEQTLAELLSNLRENKQVASWSKMLIKALEIIRFERLDESAILKTLNDSKISQADKKTRILSDLHNAYVEELKSSNSIDFDDMIIRAIDVINNGQYLPEWKYILVDEFQDISTSRMQFVDSIIDKGPDPSLTVVGDDWQSIYRFNGGKLELTTRFDDLVGLHTLTMLQKSFRYNNSIADTAGAFIMENPEQYQKLIETHDLVNESQVYLLDDKSDEEDGLYQRIFEIVRKIREEDPEGSIAIIARYNHLLKEASEFLKKEKLRGVDFWSFHKSKGLEVDYGILIGLTQGKMGFPSENCEDAIPEALLPTVDSYPYSEERRLLYVGITRSKKKCYLIASATAPSEFVTELLAPKYGINVFSETFQERHRILYKCINCQSGYLRLAKGQYNEYYKCSSDKGCSVGIARVCKKCGSPSFDQKHESKCSNPSCDHSMKICNKCGRPMKIKEGKFGKFWGCTGYGSPDDQCKNTRKIV